VSPESATPPANAPVAEIPHMKIAAATVNENFRSSPSERDTHLLNPINLLPKIVWPFPQPDFLSIPAYAETL
jgi:hypothetical protein